MLSRVADSLFWLSRYIERGDSMMRMLKTNYASSQDLSSGFTWKPVLTIFSDMEKKEIAAMERNGRDVLIYMVTDRENGNSVYNIVTRARENARSVQDNITIELWQCLNTFYHLVKDDALERKLRTGDPVTVLDSLIKQNMIYYGVLESTMFRGEGFSFMNLGHFLERAQQSINLLDVKFSDLSYDLEKTADITYWKHLLLSISGYNLYLKTYRSGFDARNILHQIIFNMNFPRSVLYSLHHLEQNFEQLKTHVDPDSYHQINFMIGKLRSKIQYSNLDHVSKVGLHNYLVGINEDLQAIGNALNQHYFAYT